MSKLLPPYKSLPPLHGLGGLLLAVGFSFCLGGCLGFEPTTPPAAELVFKLDLLPETTAKIRVYDDNDQLIASTEITADQLAGTIESPSTEDPCSNASEQRIRLKPNLDFGPVRLVVHAGEQVLKAITPTAKRDEPVDLKCIDFETTAITQVIQEKIGGQGGSFSSIPSSALANLIEQAENGETEMAAFNKIVTSLLENARVQPTHTTTAFNDLDALLNDSFVGAHPEDLPSNIAADYRNALTAAASRLEMTLDCDASLVTVMFTVDVSGEAMDGNGAPQLIRQPTKAGKVFLAIAVDDTSPIADNAGLLKQQMVPNDADTVMFDDGTNGDEKAGDGIFTRVLVLPRGMRVKYKYTNGSAGEGWTRTEEWPGNARILLIDDVLTSHSDGSLDCLVIRRDTFGDEASNKNFVNLNSRAKAAGGSIGFERDLGGIAAAKTEEGYYIGGLSLADFRQKPPLTPEGVAEAMENGICSRCPAPLTLSTDDHILPELVSAEFISTSRIKVNFSEAIEFQVASDSKNYLVLDGAQQPLAIQNVATSGSVVTLTINGGIDFSQTHTLYVKNLKDASANANPLNPNKNSVVIGPDRTPPQIISVQPLPLRDFNSAAFQADPTIGQVLLVTFDEEMDRTTAENIGNYQIKGLAGSDLTPQAAYLSDRDQIWLVTGPQGKRKPYELQALGIRDLSGNLLKDADPLLFNGFALYQVTFGAVPGFAFLNLKGTERGLPKGENLYLTGTILVVARDLEGNPIGVTGRSDVTGIPEFEMTPSDQLYQGEPIYTITLLAPPGSYSWKVAHGTPGEYKDPPPTLEKVHKSLCTTTDATGVNIDPVNLTALSLPGSSGDKPISYLDYSKAVISKTGQDAPGPFTVKSGETMPTPTIMFKRENPDEICVVQSSDKNCPAIVIGTWRDLEEFNSGTKRNDYDDGLPEVEPVRLQADTSPPKLRDVKVRDSESLLLSFDERLAVQATDLTVTAKQAKSGADFKIWVETIGSFGSSLLPHQILIRTAKMDNGVAYKLALNGLVDAFGNKQSTALEQSWVAPQSEQPFTPLVDTNPPRVLSVLPKTATSLLIQFNKKISATDGANTNNFSILADSGTPPTVQSAAIQPGGQSVLLTTGAQIPEAAYTLVVKNISDLSNPPNVLTEQKIKFKGFGDTTPPKVLYASAMSPTEVAVVFSEGLSPTTAQAASSYKIESGGLSVISAKFSGDSELKDSAFDPARTNYVETLVVIQTSKMTAGQTYKLTPAGVTDLSGNSCTGSIEFKGVDKAPTVTVVMTYKISNTDTVSGMIPARALSPEELAKDREGVFILGCAASDLGTCQSDDPITKQLGNFPAEGQPLSGPEPQLTQSGENIYSIQIKNVPLGTSLHWKAFASYKVGKSPLADGTPGPAAFGDGQEYPGNENGVRILGDKNGDGVVRINNLFGDEITFKKFANKPSFVWVMDDYAWTP